MYPINCKETNYSQDSKIEKRNILPIVYNFESNNKKKNLTSLRGLLGMCVDGIEFKQTKNVWNKKEGRKNSIPE
jgi:hypothetical protein